MDYQITTYFAITFAAAMLITWSRLCHPDCRSALSSTGTLLVHDYDSIVVHVDHPAFAPQPLAVDDDAFSLLAAGVHLGANRPAPAPIMDNILAVPPHFVGDEPMEEMIAPHELGVDGADEDHDDPDTADSESSSDGNAWYPLTAFSPDHPVGEPNRLK